MNETDKEKKIMKAIIRIFKKLASPITFVIDTIRILIHESENGGIDGTEAER